MYNRVVPKLRGINKFSQKESLVALILLFLGLIIVGYFIFNSRAADISQEAENGAGSGPTAIRDDSTASNSKYITFGQNDALQLSSANAVLYYQQFNNTPTWLANSYPLIGKPRLVITRHQNSDTDERFAVEKIHQTGALAYRYLQYYWFPDNKVDLDNGINISNNMDWVYCMQGNTPVFGREIDGVKSYFLDLNERAVLNNLKAYYAQVKSWGYDGVFVDIGRGARTGRSDSDVSKQITSKSSTCTQDPVISGRNFADSYIETITQAKAIGLKTILNYDRAYLPGSKLPNNWYNFLDWTLDESVNNSTTISWQELYASNKFAEDDGEGKTIQLIKEEIQDINGKPITDKNAVYFRVGKARLFSSPVAVNSLDPRLYPELASAFLTNPFVAGPFSMSCDNESIGECVWGRRYSSGMVLVNNTNQAKTINSLGLGTQSCKTIKNLYSGQMLSGGCLNAINQTLPAKSGRVYTYN